MLTEPTLLAHHGRNIRIYCSKFSSCCSISLTLKWGFFGPQDRSSSACEFITFWPALEADNSQCNGGPNSTTASSTVITVAAGSQVKAIWRHTLTSGSNDVVDPSHKVRVNHYPLNWQITDGAIFSRVQSWYTWRKSPIRRLMLVTGLDGLRFQKLVLMLPVGYPWWQLWYITDGLALKRKIGQWQIWYGCLVWYLNEYTNLSDCCSRWADNYYPSMHRIRTISSTCRADSSPWR
jgi:hypothetical protein